MYTIAETDEFKAQAEKIWKPEERLDFFTYLSAHPLDGDVIPNGGGLRKIRWQAKGRGKRGGVRVIYYNMLADGLIIAVAVYAKNEQTDLTPKQLKTLKDAKK